MKSSVATAALVLSLALGPVHAGGMVSPIMEEEVTQAAAQGSRAGIIVPVLALILVAMAVSRSNRNDGGGPGGGGGGDKILPPSIVDPGNIKVWPIDN